MENKLYTVKEVAKALGFSTNTVYKYLEEGQIKATRLGEEGRFRIPEEEVVRLLGLQGKQLGSVIAQAQTQTATQKPISRIPLPNSKDDSKLSLLHKVSNPDLFDWFLALCAIFIGVVYFLFPLNYQLIAIDTSLVTLLILMKMVLIVGGIGLMGVDVFFSEKKNYHHILIRFPLALVFLGLFWVFFQTKEYWAGSFFSVLALYCFITIFWQKKTYLKFISFIYILVIVSGLVFARDPAPHFGSIFKDFIAYNPGIFELFVIVGSTVIFSMIVYCYYQNKTLLSLFSWLLAGLFFVLSIGFINDQGWNRAVVCMLITCFVLLMPFEEKFESLSKFSRKQALISFFWLVLIVIVGVVIINYTQYTYKEVKLREFQSQAETGERIAKNILLENIKLVTNFSQDTELISLLSEKKINQESLDVIAKQTYFTSNYSRRISILDTNGKIFSAYPVLDAGIQQTANISDRDYFKTAKELKKTIISDAIKPRQSNLPVALAVIAPIVDQQGEIRGYLVSALDIPKLIDAFSQLNQSGESEFVLADAKRTIFIHPIPEFVGKKVQRNKALINALSGKSGTMEGISDQGIYMLQAYTPVRDIGWGIVVQQPYSEAFRSSSYVAFTIFLITILSGVGTLLVTLYLTGRNRE